MGKQDLVLFTDAPRLSGWSRATLQRRLDDGTITEFKEGGRIKVDLAEVRTKIRDLRGGKGRKKSVRLFARRR